MISIPSELSGCPSPRCCQDSLESPLALDPSTFQPLIPTCLPAVYLHCPRVCRTDLCVSPHYKILFAVVLSSASGRFLSLRRPTWTCSFTLPTFVFQLWILHTLFVMTNLTGRQTNESSTTWSICQKTDRVLKRTYVFTKNSEGRAAPHSEKATGCKEETELSNQKIANNLIYNCRASTNNNKKSHEV